MTDKDFNEFSALLGTVWEVFKPDKVISDTLIAAYFVALGKIDIADIKSALSKIMSASTFFPKPVEIINLIKGGGTDDIAFQQATTVLEAIRRIGPYRSVRFEDAVTTSVIKKTFGGWTKICKELVTDEEKWFIKNFCAAYKSFAATPVQNIAEKLPGIVEAQNQADGYPVKTDPILIGTSKTKKFIGAK